MGRMRRAGLAAAAGILFGLVLAGAFTFGAVNDGGAIDNEAQVARELWGVGACIAALDVMLPPIDPVELDSVIEAGGKGRWIGEPVVFAGTIGEAVAAAGGQLVKVDGGEPWLVTGSDEGAIAGSLRPMTTASGREVWIKANSLRLAGCPSG